MGPSSEDFRYLLDQMNRNTQDLKQDFRIGIASINESLKSHIEDDADKFSKLEAKVDELEKPLYKMLGAGGLLFVLVEVAFRSFDYFHR